MTILWPLLQNFFYNQGKPWKNNFKTEKPLLSYNYWMSYFQSFHILLLSFEDLLTETKSVQKLDFYPGFQTNVWKLDIRKPYLFRVRVSENQTSPVFGHSLYIFNCWNKLTGTSWEMIIPAMLIFLWQNYSLVQWFSTTAPWTTSAPWKKVEILNI